MNTDLFQQLDAAMLAGEGCEFKVEREADGNLTVTVIPRIGDTMPDTLPDQAQIARNALATPLRLRGSAADLDATFAERLTTTSEARSKLRTSFETLIDTLAEARQHTQQATQEARTKGQKGSKKGSQESGSEAAAAEPSGEDAAESPDATEAPAETPDSFV